MGYRESYLLNARYRQAIVLRHRYQPTAEPTNAESKAPINWMARLKRVFDTDLNQCPNCGARLHVIGDVADANVIVHIPAQPALVGGLPS